MLNIESSIITDYKCDSRVLLLVFGGIHGGIGIPVFEFNKITEKFNIKKLFIRDIRQAWYQGGLPEIGENIYSISDYINKQIEQQGCEKTIVIGNSAGGYAALLFGNILNADKVIAFSPQTFLNLKARIFHFDYRWSRQIINMYKLPSLEKSTLDLKNVFLQKVSNKTKYKVLYSRKDRLDTIHAKRMGIFFNITLSSFDYGGHKLVKQLRDDHILYELLSSTINDW